MGRVTIVFQDVEENGTTGVELLMEVDPPVTPGVRPEDLTAAQLLGARTLIEAKKLMKKCGEVDSSVVIDYEALGRGELN